MTLIAALVNVYCVLPCRIIEPLTSRCSKFRFKPLADGIQTQRILDICKKENVQITTEVSDLSIFVVKLHFPLQENGYITYYYYSSV